MVYFVAGLTKCLNVGNEGFLNCSYPYNQAFCIKKCASAHLAVSFVIKWANVLPSNGLFLNTSNVFHYQSFIL